ncbi:MAG: amidohydrolase, partial [Verrucomicrobia bacterium]|nr:amidohydrolase [Verrucomicrobiota bacterium]
MKSSAKILLVLLFGVHLAKVSWGEPVIYRAKKVHATPFLTYEPGEILVENGKIKAIGKSVKKPAKCKTIEWRELEIYPGLISPGSSLGLAEINALRPTRDEREVGSHTPEIEAWVAINPDSELIPVARANGIAHALVVPMGGTISGTSGLIALAGW